MSRKGQITYVGLAPLTNLALALKTDPSLVSNLRSVVLMGGNCEGMGNVTSMAEFNFHCDPEAAHVVADNLREAAATVVTWELCYKYVKFSKVGFYDFVPLCYFFGHFFVRESEEI